MLSPLQIGVSGGRGVNRGGLGYNARKQKKASGVAQSCQNNTCMVFGLVDGLSFLLRRARRSASVISGNSLISLAKTAAVLLS